MMDLTPLEVRKKKGDFRRQIRGYDPDSVDDFLDLVADRLEELVRENAAMAESSGGLEQRVAEYREREKALTEALVSAQQLREEMRARAVKDAEAARSQAAREADEHRSLAAQEAEEARRHAREIVDSARAEADRLLATARLEAEEERAKAVAELHRTRAVETRIIDRLQTRRTELLRSYRDLLEREVSDLESLEAVARGDLTELPPVPAAPMMLTAVAEDPPVAVDLVVEENAVAAPEATALDEDALPAMSADLAALIEAAESDVDLAWSDEAVEMEPAESAAPESPVSDADPRIETEADLEAGEAVAGPAEAIATADDQDPADAGDLVLIEAAGDEQEASDAAEEAAVDAWLADIVDEDVAAEPKAESRRPAWESVATGPESDEDFIDSLIAEAGVVPTQAGDGPDTELPDFLSDGEPASDELVLAADELELETPDAAGMQAEPMPTVAEADTAASTDQHVCSAEEETAGGIPAQDVEPITVQDRVRPTDEAAQHIDPLTVLDEDEGFDALFGDGDDDPAEFDFDAALASATGFPGLPNGSRSDADAAFDLGIELDDPGSPLDLGRSGAGSFHMDDLRMPQVNGPFSPTRPSELTVRPLSPEEEAPDLPVESRQRDETDDDMFSTMFRGR